MKRVFLSASLLAVLASAGGCATQAETVGTFGGAAVGAAVGGGNVGTLGGAMVGYAAGRAYDEHHH